MRAKTNSSPCRPRQFLLQKIPLFFVTISLSYLQRRGSGKLFLDPSFTSRIQGKKGTDPDPQQRIEIFVTQKIVSKLSKILSGLRSNCNLLVSNLSVSSVHIL
jgi:hypothetical protein